MIHSASKPSVTVEHTLPGRVRMRLSHPLQDERELGRFIGEHPGMGAITYTARTGSLVVRFDPHLVTSEEITLRTAFRYAIDQGGRPVRLLAAPERVVLQNSAVVSGTHYKQILSYVESEGIDLIIMGMGTPVQKVIFGSVAEKVSRLAAVPVMLVK